MKCFILVLAFLLPVVAYAADPKEINRGGPQTVEDVERFMRDGPKDIEEYRWMLRAVDHKLRVEIAEEKAAKASTIAGVVGGVVGTVAFISFAPVIIVVGGVVGGVIGYTIYKVAE